MHSRTRVDFTLWFINKKNEPYIQCPMLQKWIIGMKKISATKLDDLIKVDPLDKSYTNFPSHQFSLRDIQSLVS